MKVVRRKVADAKSGMNDLADGSRRYTLGLYASILHNVDQSLFAVSINLKKMFDCEAKALQQGVHDALCDAVGGVQKSFADAPEVVDRTLSLIFGHLKRVETG